MLATGVSLSLKPCGERIPERALAYATVGGLVLDNPVRVRFFPFGFGPNQVFLNGFGDGI